MGADLGELEARLEYRFRDRQLLVRALTHRSHSRSHRPGVPPPGADNEQLEFLGDAVLGLFVSEALVQALPEHREGNLSKKKGMLVSAAHLNRVARAMGLGDFLVLGKSEEALGGRMRLSLLSDALEAVLAAVYLDGGPEPARRIVVRHVLGGGSALGAIEEELADHKSHLQEITQGRKMALPSYQVIATEGPSHDRRFTVEVRVGELRSRASSTSKKAASQLAAKGLLDVLLPQLGAAPESP